MQKILHGVILVFLLLLVGCSILWGIQILKNVRSIRIDIKDSATSGFQVVTSTYNPNLEDASRQAEFETVKSRSYTANEQIYELLHQCKGTLDQFQGVKFCRGHNRLVLKQPNKVYRVLSRVDATGNLDVPLWLYATQTQLGGSQLIIRYEANACPFNAKECEITGFKAMSHRLDLITGDFATLGHYPQRSRPYWSPSGEHALFITQTCGPKRCDDAPLYLYDLKKDELTVASSLRGSDQYWAMDITGKKLGFWESVLWISDKEWQAEYVSDAGIRQRVTGSRP